MPKNLYESADLDGASPFAPVYHNYYAEVCNGIRPNNYLWKV